MSIDHEQITALIKKTEAEMVAIIKQFQKQLMKYHVGRPNPDLIINLKVDCYGSQMPIQQLANVLIPDAHQMVVKPYDVKQIPNITKAINQANLRMSMHSEPNLIRLQFPSLTESNRKAIAKDAHDQEEIYKVKIRNERRTTMQIIKKDITSEGERLVFEEQVQDLTDRYIGEINKIGHQKQTEIMTI